MAGPLLLQVYGLSRYGSAIRLTDEFFYHAHARSWYFDGDCSYENDLLTAPGFKNAGLYVAHRTPTGHVMNHFPTGTAVLTLPFLVLADGVTVIRNTLKEPSLPRDGYSFYYQVFPSLGHVLFGTMGLILCYALSARYFPPLIAAISTLSVWLGTNLFYYIGFEPTHSHAAAFGWLALMLWVVDNTSRRGFSAGRSLVLGISCGMLVVTRPQDLIWCLVPLLVLTRRAIDDVRGAMSAASVVGHALLAIASAAICYIPQAMVNVALFGSALKNTYAQLTIHGQPVMLHWWDPDLLRPLLNTRTGVVWTTPLMLVGLVGVAGLLAKRSWVPTSIAIAMSVMYYAVSCIWWTYSGFGNRYLASCSIAAALGICVVLTWASRRRARAVATGIGIAFLAAWQVALFIAADRQYWDAHNVGPLLKSLGMGWLVA
jgi:hypothetical protein